MGRVSKFPGAHDDTVPLSGDEDYLSRLESDSYIWPAAPVPDETPPEK